MPSKANPTKKRILLSWSSGKDIAWCLHVLLSPREYEVVGLLTTFNKAANRVAMHAVRRELVERQAFAAGLPPWPYICLGPVRTSNTKDYWPMSAGKQSSTESRELLSAISFSNVRAYREKQLKGTGLEPIFPLWQQRTDGLARAMISSGLRAKLTCVDTKQLSAEFVGQDFDEDLLAPLPGNVDPCGERGEFHSFVYAGPMFDLEVPVVVGERVVRDQFVFADLSSASMPASLSFQRL